jgi:photosystem II stability/assembly factor-like uncharacterized protein
LRFLGCALGLALAASGCMWSSGGDPIEGSTGGGPGGSGGSGGPGPVGGNPQLNTPWTNITGNLAGLASECGNLSFLSSRPGVDTLFVGIALKGVWANGAADQWTQIGQNTGSDPITNATNLFIYDPDHPETFWEVGYHAGFGVFKTTDNGSTFLKVGELSNSETMSVDFSDPGRKTMLAGTHERARAVYRSNDGGVTWTSVGDGLPEESGYSANVHVVDPSTYLVGTANGKNSGVFRTADGGMTWTQVYQTGVAGRILKASDGFLYWGLDNRAGVIKSGDGGATWTLVGGQGLVRSIVDELPDGRLGAFDNDAKRLLLSSDHGATWKVTASLPFNISGFVYSSFRKALVLWHGDCLDKVPTDAIMSTPFMADKP